MSRAEEIAAKAEALTKSDSSLTKEQAIAKALAEDPEMYSRYLSDQTKGA